MLRSEYNHKKLQGNDASQEISLKEYGLAWIETKTDILFYYSIDTDNTRFDFCSIPKDYDVFKEHNWADWADVENYVGSPMKDQYLTQQITDLMSYYGAENIFGISHCEGLIYPQVISGGNVRLKDIEDLNDHFSAEQIAGFAEPYGGVMNIKVINKFYREQDESHLWPINNRFNVANRAIRKVRGLGTCGIEYCLALESEISRIVNKE